VRSTDFKRENGMEWWMYLGIAVIVLVITGFILRARRKKEQSTDDIYPMW
jgi:LPXTG-motif cell wall-anchored protein